MREEFLFNLNGLIDGEFVIIETDSKKVLDKIIKLMDSASNDSFTHKVQNKSEEKCH